MIRLGLLALPLIATSCFASMISPNLLNAGSKSMAVDGSSVNKTFSYAPSVPTDLQGISLLIKDEGTTSLSNFGAISGLTNGVVLQTVIGGVTTTIATMKDNADLVTRFSLNSFGNGAVLSILSIVTPQGFGATNNMMIGTMQISPNTVILNSGDEIDAIVKDNLTAVDVLQIAIKARID